jgi:hypothetical protein
MNRHNGETFQGENLILIGDNNTVEGDNCAVSGKKNIVKGNGCTVDGDKNTVSGYGCRVTGNENIVSGDKCYVSGTRNTVTGKDCSVVGLNNFYPQDKNQKSFTFGSETFDFSIGQPFVITQEELFDDDFGDVGLWEEKEIPKGESEKADKDTPESLVCKVCMENKIDAVIIDCGHACLCRDCGKKIVTQSCPICRKKIVRGIKNMYFS